MTTLLETRSREEDHVAPTDEGNLRWAIRRWTPRHFVYRARLPVRRRRWRLARETSCKPFAKNADARPTTGPAIVFGEFSGKHGLGRAAAYDVSTLRERHSSVHAIDIGPYLAGKPIQPPKLDGPIENLYLFCQPDTYDTVFALLDAGHVRNAYRVARWVWETPIFPEDWRFAEQLVHEIWAPSDFCAETFRKAVHVPVSVKPYLVSLPPESAIDMRARLRIPPEAFMGLAVMDIQSCPARKNPWAHIQAWSQAFGDDPAAILVMKLRVSKHTRIVLQELRELAGKASNIILVPDELDHLEIAALHRAADVYLSLHRSEGFGLNIYEALLLGKAVVATDWSANSEFGPQFPNYKGVAYEMVRYKDWMKHYSDDQFEWAEPNTGDAARLLKQARQGK